MSTPWSKGFQPAEAQYFWVNLQNQRLHGFNFYLHQYHCVQDFKERIQAVFDKTPPLGYVDACHVATLDSTPYNSWELEINRGNWSRKQIEMLDILFHSGMLSELMFRPEKLEPNAPLLTWLDTNFKRTGFRDFLPADKFCCYHLFVTADEQWEGLNEACCNQWNITDHEIQDDDLEEQLDALERVSWKAHRRNLKDRGIIDDTTSSDEEYP